MPLGVLFRGNAEGLLRKRLIQQGYIKGIIGLPPNLFYGTGIAACLIVIDKEHAAERKSIFMIDASKGFIKDGNKNRLREQDIHKIIDTFLSETENPKYSRIVPIEEIASEKNDYNLNIPRYIDNQDEEDIQDIQAHLSGGVPRHDVESLEAYWQVFPTLKKDLFNATEREGYFELSVETESVREFILNHENSIDFKQSLLSEFESWKQNIVASLKTMELGAKPKEIIEDVSERLLQLFTGKPLTDKYDLYQLLMDYWYEVMQDDVYVISTGGWSAGKELKPLMKKNSKGVDKAVSGLDGLEGRIIPTSLVIQEYFPEVQQQIEDIEAELDSIKSRKAEIDEEHGTEEGLLEDAYTDGKTSKKQLKDTLVNLGKRDDENAEVQDLLTEYLELLEKEPSLKKSLNALKDEIERKVISKYPNLSEEEIKTLIVDKKWFSTISERIESDLDNISHRLSNRIKELADRYEKPLIEIKKEVDDLTSKVEEHLKAMGMVL